MAFWEAEQQTSRKEAPSLSYDYRMAFCEAGLRLLLFPKWVIMSFRLVGVLKFTSCVYLSMGKELANVQRAISDAILTTDNANTFKKRIP
jgi:hypothetical protein